MTSKVPFVKQETVWLAFVPRLLFIGIFCLIFYQIDKHNFFILAFVLYLIVLLGLRKLLFPKVIHKGINFIKEGKFDEAIQPIQKTIEYYTKNDWVDKYRFLLMISSSKRTIRESSICNLAYCPLQTGETKKAKCFKSISGEHYSKKCFKNY